MPEANTAEAPSIVKAREMLVAAQKELHGAIAARWTDEDRERSESGGYSLINAAADLDRIIFRLNH